ncbi:metal ABC transporter substrate-binding protein [Actinomycetota bacterium]
MFRLTRLAAVGALAPVLAVAACGASGSGSEDAAGGKVPVSAAFYALAYAAEQVGGGRVHVSTLTKPGGEPHDLELTPKDVVDLAKSRVVVYQKGFQPAVDDAVASQAPHAAFDVAPIAGLDVPAQEEGHEGESADEHAGHDHGPLDPHFWLDPTKYATVATALGERLATADAEHAAEYRANAKAFAGKLTALDKEFKDGLASCKSRDLVTGHAAFGYLAQRYDLHQVGISGISPDVEPNAAQMKDLVEHVREAKVGTVYAETLVSPALAETIAKEGGATVAVLDPIEAVTDKSAGDDYLEIMRSNLATLKKGQQCS